MNGRWMSAGALAMALIGLGCSGDKGRAARAKEAPKPAEQAEEPLRLEPFWEDPGYLRLRDDAECPAGFWALIPGEAPGETKEEKQRNEALRADLVRGLKGATFALHFSGPTHLTLGEYSSATGEFPIEIRNVLRCESEVGTVTFALGPVEAAPTPGRDEGQYYWQGAPVAFAAKVPFSQSVSFRNDHKLDLDARILFRLGKLERHRKLIRVQETAEERAERKKHDIPAPPSGPEDWGAGWLIRAEVRSVRLAVDQGRTPIVDRRQP